MFRTTSIFIIKVGTQVITNKSGTLNSKRMVSLVKQISLLKKKQIHIVLVSSGAIGAASVHKEFFKNKNPVIQRQVLASIGQISLLSHYKHLFEKEGLLCAQVLATKEDFRDRHHYLNMKNCLEGLLKSDVVPIVNENDVVAVNELMFTDNDELAALIAAMLDAKALWVLTNVDGVFDRNPEDKNAQLISTVNPKKDRVEKFISPVKSQFGRGGMHSKCRTATRLSSLGISTSIVNGQTEGILLYLHKGKKVGTKFLAQKKISSVKKWISQATGQEKGAVVINKCAEKELLDEEKARSLLPIGIIKIEGTFSKGDLIQIKNEQRKTLGYGIAKYGSQTAETSMGVKGNKALIHYDYLFLLNEEF